MDNPEKGQASALHKSVPGPAYSPSQPQALRTDSSGHSDAQISRDQHSAKPQLGESSEKKKGIEEHYGDIVERNWNLFGAPWATTNGDDSRGSEWSREKGGEAISELHRFNIGKARLALYKDYIKIANQGEETGDSEECEGQTSLASLQADLKNYGSAMAEYRAFIESRSLWESMELDKSLLACAVQSAAIEELESNQELNHSTNQALLGRIKNQVKTRYQADIVTGYAVMLQPVRTALDPEIDKKTQEANRYRDNLLMAMFGSLALIVPMLIMSLHPTQVTTLLTTSIFVSVVATILAAVMDNAEPKDVVGAVAAYTAVLVVFVGTTNSGTSTGSSTSPSSSATSGKHLSSGAIVGIVLGLLVGLLLLGTLCYFCVLKAGFEVFLVLFGLGKRRRRERMRRERTEIIDERLL